YHLGVVVDDAVMKVSHIIRGRDWLPSTPVHLLLFKYLNFPLPEIGHLTDILDPAGGKLSKRKGSVSCEEFLAEGYLPEAILNFIMLLGWAPKDNREIFSLADFVKEFPKGNLQTANPVFNRKKLDWFNGYYIRQKSPKQLVQLIKAFTPKGMSATLINQTIPLVKDRLVKLSDFSILVDFLIKEPKMIPTMLLQKGKTKEETKNILSLITSHYLPITNNEWKHPKLEKVGRKLVEKTSWSAGDLFMTIRVAITGKTATPPLFESMEVLGKEKTLRRLKLATKKLS
ncbi:MAG: glutamyl-tRNA synthetase, partial [Microgenomates group bacterium LiPW_31]